MATLILRRHVPPSVPPPIIAEINIMLRSITLTLALPVLLTAMPAAGQTVTAELIPGASTANDMSPDGRYVVGTTIGSKPYLRDMESGDPSTLLYFGLDAVAVSDDGSVVLGNITDRELDAQVAAIWTEADGWTSIGHLGDGCGSYTSAYELSADGTVATGLGWLGCSGAGFRWSEATGMVALEHLANGNNRSSVLSADGSVIGGFAQGSFSRTPARWDASGNGLLMDPPNGDALGEIHGMSDDGTVMLGTWNQDAVKWTNGVMEVIGQGSYLPGWTGIPMDIADDGTIVGFDTILTSRQAWIQPGGVGDIISMSLYISTHGGSIPDGAAMQVCQAISADGSIVIGHGAFSNAWRVIIEPTTCVGDLDGDGTVGFTDLVAVLAAWGPCDGCLEDIDEDGVVGFTDLVTVLSNWGPCR
jgi:uncharacterized membrane protein